MQTLTVEHKKIESTNNNQKQIVSEPKQVEEYENKRGGHGKNIALTRNVYRLLYSDTYYIQSESSDNVYYFVRFNPDVFEWCSCLDNSTRHVKCKHIFSIEYAIKLGTLKDIEHLPKEAKRYPEKISTTAAATIATAVKAKSKSYLDDDYDF